MAFRPLKRLTQSAPVQRAIGLTVAEYLRLVWKTSRVVVEPADLYERANAAAPYIVGMWHGQHFLVPFLDRDRPTKVLISRHRDGEINAIAAARLGVGLIRGSGAQGGDFRRKGGVPAFYEMLDTLEQGCNVALTADVPKVSRVAGRGIANLAVMSGRPVFVVAVATSKRITVNSWDHAALNLPFGRVAVVGIGPIHAAASDEHSGVEQTRQAIETALNTATARAYEIVDHRS
jgi:lysophospholipid acyltransferase (LPLAT)-like uncharacterized protein